MTLHYHSLFDIKAINNFPNGKKNQPTPKPEYILHPYPHLHDRFQRNVMAVSLVYIHFWEGRKNVFISLAICLFIKNKSCTCYFREVTILSLHGNVSTPFAVILLSPLKSLHF